MGDDTQLEFCTLGMFIIDEIEFMNGRTPANSIIGGAGTYAALGARLVAGSENASLVGWTVDTGSDFPLEFRATIDLWQTSCVFRSDEARLTTRAWNGYGPNEYRAFKYLTAKLRLDENSLSDAQIFSRAFHFVCSPQRCISLIKGILSRRRDLLDLQKDSRLDSRRPHFVWEPVPDLCLPEETDNFRQACGYVDVVSPNAEEFAALFESSNPEQTQNELANMVLGWGIGSTGEGALIIREGSRGCTGYNRVGKYHLPAYHTAECSAQVVDPTGGGNTFLGAITMAMGSKVVPTMADVEGWLGEVVVLSSPGWRFSGRFVCQMIYAVVAASYAIEQIGMPRLAMNDGLPGKWNGETFAARMATYVKREKEKITRCIESK